MKALIRIVLGAVVLAGCADDLESEPAPTDIAGPPPPAGESAIAVDAERYVLRSRFRSYEAKIGCAYTNPTDATISLVNCHGGFPLYLDRWDGEGWVIAFSPILAACLSAPIEIAPGDTYEFEFVIAAGKPGSNVQPQFEVDPIPGHYRMVVAGAYWNYDPEGARLQLLPARPRLGTFGPACAILST